jgi:exosortase/archaeosortase family protein
MSHLEKIRDDSCFSVSIAVGCDGLEPLAMFVGGILVFPMAFRLKWPGILAGAVVLFILNLIRIAGLFLAGLYWPGAFDFLHLHGGFILFAAIAILLWMIWANWALQKSKNTSHA